MRIVRELGSRLATRCTDALLSGVPIDRVQSVYFDAFHALVDEAEAKALLALGESSEAVTAIEGCIDALEALAEQLWEEIQAAGDESEA